MSTLCVTCQKTVGKRQHGIECDFCGLWTHRNCGTGYSPQEYKAAIDSNTNLPYSCRNCTETVRGHTDRTMASGSFSDLMSPDMESTREPYDPQTLASDDSSDTMAAASESSREGIPGVPYRGPVSFPEQSLVQENPRVVAVEATPLEMQWEIIAGASQRGKNILTNSHGFAYTIKLTRRNGNVLWHCSKRGGAGGCKAAVTQTSPNVFIPGSMSHTCNATNGVAKVLKVRLESKQESASNPYISASTVVKKVCTIINSDII